MGKRQRCRIVLEVGKRLRRIREEQELTLMEVGERMDYAHQNISAIELGKINVPLKTLARLMAVYDVPLSELFLGLRCNLVPRASGERERRSTSAV